MMVSAVMTMIMYPATESLPLGLYSAPAVFCEFEADENSGYLKHPGGKAVAMRMESLASLLVEAEAWNERLQSGSMPNGLSDDLRWIFLQMGGWTNQGRGDGVVLVVLELPNKNKQVDVDMTTAQYVKLVQLGPHGGDGDLFDDLAILRMLWEEEGNMFAPPKLSRLRIWQSSHQSEYKGGIVALQSFYGDEFELPMEVHGRRADAQFFTDIILGKDEVLISVSGYFVENQRAKEESIFGSLEFRTSAEMSHTVGMRETGTFFDIDLSGPNGQGFFATALAGAVSPEGKINGLHLLMCHKDLFCAPSPRSMSDWLPVNKSRPMSSASQTADDGKGAPPILRTQGGPGAVERGRTHTKAVEDKPLSMSVSMRRPPSAASMRASHTASPDLAASKQSVQVSRQDSGTVKKKTPYVTRFPARGSNVSARGSIVSVSRPVAQRV